MPFAEERFDGFLRQVAVPGADVDHERIRSTGGRGQRSAQPRINGLANQMFHDCPMQSLT